MARRIGIAARGWQEGRTARGEVPVERVADADRAGRDRRTISPETFSTWALMQ
jgi:hypothetical protein